MIVPPKKIGYLPSWASIIIILLSVGVLAYLIASQFHLIESTVSSYQIVVTGSSAALIKGGTTLQTIPASQEAIDAEARNNSQPLFIPDQDVNFDGNSDLAMLTTTGESDANYFYDYYIFNPSTERLEKSDVLTQISNPKVYPAQKQVVSNYRSGPEWYFETYEYDGTKYHDSGPLVDRRME